MAQMWSVIGIMATAFGGMIGLSFRAMTQQGKTLAVQMQGLRSEVTAQMEGLRSEVTAQMEGLRSEVTAQVEGLRGEVSARIDGLRGEFNAQFQRLRTEMNGRFDHLTVRVDKLESIDHEVHALSIKVMGREIPPAD